MYEQDQINRLKEVLFQKKKSQRWLSDQLGITEQTVSTWCLNKNQPTIRQMARIAKLLGVQMGELFYPTEMIILKD